MITLTGHCHCGSVQFECDTEVKVKILDCNCSMCRLTGMLHLIVKAEHFRIIKGQDQLTEYRFNTQKARHLFCKVCGIKTFYVPRSHPDCVSVHLKAIDESLLDITLVPFDGQNWEVAKAQLSAQEAALHEG